MRNRIQTTTIAALSCTAIELITPVAAQITNKIVKIDTGTIEGAISGDVLSFKGIPYAAPPVGDLRWQPPRPVQSWTGVRKTIEYGHDCMQTPDPSDAAPPGTTPAEDCLVVNVWRPAQIKPGEKLPVMVWIHGGAFVNGGSSTPLYDGSAIARQGVVVVSLNYRLSRFGFFAHPALTAANEKPLANYGLPYNPDRSDLMMFTLDRGSQMTADPLKTRLDLVERAANSNSSLLNASLTPCMDTAGFY